MKKSLTILSLTFMLLAAAGTFSSCDKIKDNLFKAFSAGGGEANFTVPVITTTNKFDTIDIQEIYLNVDSIIKAETGGLFSLDNVSKITVESAEITINNPDADNNISNFDYGLVLFNTFNPATNDWNNTMAVAADNIPDAFATSYSLAVLDGVNLKDHMRGTKLVYAVAAKARRITTKPLDCTLKVRVHIE
jgi:hypothetical protein